MRDQFNQVDTNGDGQLDVAEIAQVLQFAMPEVNQDVVDFWIRAVDGDRSGTVNFEEMLRTFTATPEEQVGALFRGFDIDGDGFVDGHEGLRLLNAVYFPNPADRLPEDILGGLY